MQRLAIFAGDFSLDGAGALMQDAEAADVVGEVAELVAKSLVVADLRPDGMRSRLLDSTRIYGLGKLRASGGFHQAGRAHAEYVRSQFEHAEADCETLTSAEWLAAYAGQIDNLRVALDWAGSIEGDTMLLVALTVTAVPLWVQLSLMGGVPRAGRACAGGS